MMLWISPTEPSPLRGIADVVSMYPEDYGADILIHGMHHSVAAQRKTLPDLIASAADGRLAEQVVKLARAELPCLVLEGRLVYALDGTLVLNGWGEKVHRTRVEQMLLTLAAAGIRTFRTNTLDETVEWVQTAKGWADKPEHSTLKPKGATVKGDWGERRVKHYQIAMLTTLPGIGPELAARIVNEVGFPFILNVELAGVKGLGDKKIAAIKEVVSATEEDDRGEGPPARGAP